MTGQAPEEGEEALEPSIPLPIATQLMTTFTKAVRAYQLYLPNNPMYSRAIDAVREGFAATWAQTDEVTIQINESQFRLDGHVVLEEPGKSAESLPWTFYKDGIRELKFLQGFEKDDLPVFLQILQKARTASPDDDDLLTLMWEQEFGYLQYRYVDFVTDSGSGAGPVEALKSSEPPEKIESPRDVEGQAYAGGEEAPMQTSRPGVVEGEIATSGTWLETRGTVLTITDPAGVRFRASALQADLAHLRDGLPARIVGADPHDSLRLEASVVLAPLAEALDRSLDLIARPVAGAVMPAGIRPGAAAVLEVPVSGSAEEELAIPLAATIRDGLQVIFFKRNRSNPDEVEKVEADLGAGDGRWVVVNSGVREGDELVLGGLYPLKLSQQAGGAEAGHFEADGTFHTGKH